MPPNDAGRRALQHVEKALADRPEKNGHELSRALRCLAEFRDGLVAAHRQAPDGRYRNVLEHINGVISSVMAAQFPLGEVQWEELEKARDWMAGLLGGGMPSVAPAKSERAGQGAGA